MVFLSFANDEGEKPGLSRVSTEYDEKPGCTVLSFAPS
jgi:hypothetical protein